MCVITKIEIKPHLREYVIGKFNNGEEKPVHFPDREDIYHTIFDLTEKRPQNCQVDKGNLEIVLPDRRIGKSPETYNYLGERSVALIEKKISLRFWADLHTFLDDQKHRHGVSYTDAIHTFMKKYCITSISEDALIKNYYRWRSETKRRTERRSYTKKVAR